MIKSDDNVRAKKDEHFCRLKNFTGKAKIMIKFIYNIPKFLVDVLMTKEQSPKISRPPQGDLSKC